MRFFFGNFIFAFIARRFCRNRLKVTVIYAYSVGVFLFDFRCLKVAGSQKLLPLRLFLEL